MDQKKLRESISTAWDVDVLPSLSGLVEIPAVSPAYDAAWQEHGHLRAAVEHVRGWIAARGLPGARCDVVQLAGRAPLLLVEVPATPGATAGGTVLMYGHLDKQPPLGDWSEGLGPWQPVIRGDRLYGRGTADDGYSGYAATTALQALHEAGGEHARTVVVLETGEESGSADLPAYLQHLGDRLGDVSLVVCLDAGGGDYERLWLTSSLRGVVQATLTVRVLESGIHSGLGSGVVPSSFRIMRQLLDRLENSATGEIKVAEMVVPIPEERRTEAAELVAHHPEVAVPRPALLPGVRRCSDDEVELVLNNTWRPTLSITGAGGLPDPSVAGAVLRPWTSVRLSFRLPPTTDAQAALAALDRVLTTDVPYGARVELSDLMAMNGWHAPALAPWLDAALRQVGDDVFGKPYRSMGIGGGIPFMEMLGRRYPRAQFLVTGALGADSNAHVPDEWLHIPFAKKVTEAVAHVLDAHARAGGQG